MSRELIKKLKPNGKAGHVALDGDGAPYGQHFFAQAGPYPEGQDVIVLSAKEALDIAFELTVLNQFREMVRERIGVLYHEIEEQAKR